jgi:hypothetical protein
LVDHASTSTPHCIFDSNETRRIPAPARPGLNHRGLGEPPLDGHNLIQIIRASVDGYAVPQPGLVYVSKRTIGAPPELYV